MKSPSSGKLNSRQPRRNSPASRSALRPGSVASVAHEPGGLGSDFEGAFLDALAVVDLSPPGSPLESGVDLVDPAGAGAARTYLPKRPWLARDGHDRPVLSLTIVLSRRIQPPGARRKRATSSKMSREIFGAPVPARGFADALSLTNGAPSCVACHRHR